MAKVYTLNFDVNLYQAVFLKDRGRICVGDPQLDFRLGRPVGRDWVPLELFVLEPKLKVPNFWYFQTGEMAVDEKTSELMGPHLLRAGELLPVHVEGQGRLFLVNVLECLNCLDREKSVLPGHDRPLGTRLKYAFHAGRFSGSSLFRIPDDNRAGLYTLEETGDPGKEFKAAVEQQKLTGLKFELLWEG